MTKEEIQLRIDEIDARQLRLTAHFELVQSFDHGHPIDEISIEANSEGLTLYALELLKAAKNLDKETNTTIPLSRSESWMSGNLSIYEIRYAEKNKNVPDLVGKKKPSVAGAITVIGCLGILALIVASGIIGVYTIYNWLF